MLSGIALSSRPVGSLRVQAAGVRNLGRSSAALLRSQGQSRGFRPAPRSSLLETDVRRKSGLQSPALKRSTLETINTQLPSDKTAPIDATTKVVKRMASHYPQSKLPSSSANGGLAGDAECGLAEELLTTNPSTTAQQPGQATIQVLGSTIEPDYVIDPITNRKVFKNASKTCLGEALTTPQVQPPSSSKASGMVATTTGPLFDPHFPVTPEELRGYSQPNIDQINLFAGKRAAEKYDGATRHCPDGFTVSGQNLSNLLGTCEANANKQPECVIPEDPAMEYTDLHKYKPVMEKPTTVLEERTQEYEDLDKYQPVMEKKIPVPEDPSAQYEDLDQYKPVMEKRVPVPEDPSTQYDDLDQYNPVKYNEPDGKPQDVVENEEYKDLPKYNAVMYNEPDGKPNTSEMFAYDDLHLYDAPFLYQEPDGHPPEAPMFAYEDLHLYDGPFLYNEPDGKTLTALTAEADSKNYTDLGQYDGAFRYLEPDGKLPITDDGYSDLGSYGAVRYNEPDGKAPPHVNNLAASLGEFDLRQSASDLYTEPVGGLSGNASTSDMVAAKLKSLAQTLGDKLTPPPKVFEKSWGLDSASSAAQASITSKAPAPISSLKPKVERRLTGSRRREDPDWWHHLEPMGLETAWADENDGFSTLPVLVRRYSAFTSSLDKTQARQGVSSSSSTTGGNSANTISASNSSSDSPSSSSSSSQYSAAPPFSGSTNQPTVYKILAYDPIQQTVKIAETKSTVPDSSTALSPVEALMRLSNPTQFFPHLATLQANGFELVAGSSDALIFRRMSDPSTTEDTKTSIAINPIDMTGAPPYPYITPLSANFASPTGYVRYDPDPADDSRPPPPRFRGRAGRRRLENYSDGDGCTSSLHEFTRDDQTSSHTSRSDSARVIKKVVVVAAWTAGIAYAVGVVGEYFKSGDAVDKSKKRF